MSEERTADSLFEEYVIAPPAARGAALRRLCASHPTSADELRRMVADLVAAAAALQGLRPPERDPSSNDRPVSLDEHIDLLRRARSVEDYRVLDRIARGGMALVERVWDPRLRRAVARKVLPVDARDHRRLPEHERRALTRFLDEAHVQGSLGHPAVLPVFDTGIDAEGRPFFTMPVVHGEHLGTLIRRVHQPQPTPHDLDRLLEVLVRICEAIGHAHAHGVIHRDLKPQNVMVGRFGETYVMDWGLAKVIDPTQVPRAPCDDSLELDVLRRQLTSGDMNLLTMDGDVLGTPAYMAPEQAAGHAGDVGRLSDVYAIGAILYEMLAGAPPYDRESHSSTPAAVLDAIQRGAPVALHEVAALAPPPELAAICGRAMARHVEARYADVGELEADLRAFREGRVVRAFRVGAVAELRSWIMRNRALAITSLIATLAMIGSALTVAAVSYRTSRELGVSNARLEEVSHAAQERVEELRHSRYFNDIARAQWLLSSGEDFDRVPALLAGSDEDLRGWEWRYISALADQSELSIEAHPGTGRGVAWSPAGDQLATCGANVTVRVWNAATGALARELYGVQGHPQTPVFSNDGKWLGVGTQGDELRVWNLDSGQVALHVHELHAFPKSLVYLPGERVAAAFGSELRIYSLETEELLAEWGVGDSGWLLAYDPDAGLLIVTDQRGVAAYEETGLPRWRHDMSAARALQVEPGGVVACLDSEGSLHRLRVADGELVDRVALGGDGAASLSGDQRWIAVARGTNLTLIARKTGETVRAWSGHSAEITRVSFAPDSSRVATIDRAGVAKTWRVSELHPVRVYEGLGTDVNRVAVDPSGARIAAAERNSLVAIWDTQRLEPRDVIDVGFKVHDLEFSPDGSRLGIVGSSREVVFVDAETGVRVLAIPCVNHYGDWIRHLPDGSGFVVGGDANNVVRVVKFKRAERNAWFQTGARINGLCLSPDGAEVATMGAAGRLQIWSAETGTLLRECVVAGTVAGVGSAWSRDGRFLSTTIPGSGGSVVQIWRADDLSLVHELKHAIHVSSGAFGPEGRLFTMRSHLRVWDPELGIELLELASDATGWARSLAISADGNVVVAGGTGVKVRAWVVGDHGRATQQ